MCSMKITSISLLLALFYFSKKHSDLCSQGDEDMRDISSQIPARDDKRKADDSDTSDDEGIIEKLKVDRRTER